MMVWKFVVALIIALTCSPSVYGRGKSRSKGNGVEIEAQLGYPSMTLTNVNGDKVYYDGISVLGGGSVPLFESSGIALKINGGVQYYDYNNTANSGTQLEKSNHIGPYAGVNFSLFKIDLGYRFNVMKGRTYWVGETTNNYHEIDFTSSTIYAGLGWQLSKMLRFGVSYSMSNGSFPASETGLSDDTKWKSETIWLTLSIGTGQSFGNLLSNAFVK